MFVFAAFEPRPWKAVPRMLRGVDLISGLCEGSVPDGLAETRPHTRRLWPQPPAHCGHRGQCGSGTVILALLSFFVKIYKEARLEKSVSK